MFKVINNADAIKLCKKLSVQHANKFIEIATTFNLQIQIITTVNDQGLDRHEITAHGSNRLIDEFYILLEYNDNTFSVHTGDMNFSMTCDLLTSDNVNKIIACMAQF